MRISVAIFGPAVSRERLERAPLVSLRISVAIFEALSTTGSPPPCSTDAWTRPSPKQQILPSRRFRYRKPREVFHGYAQGCGSPPCRPGPACGPCPDVSGTLVLSGVPVLVSWPLVSRVLIWYGKLIHAERFVGSQPACGIVGEPSPLSSSQSLAKVLPQMLYGLRLRENLPSGGRF